MPSPQTNAQAKIVHCWIWDQHYVAYFKRLRVCTLNFVLQNEHPHQKYLMLFMYAPTSPKLPALALQFCQEVSLLDLGPLAPLSFELVCECTLGVGAMLALNWYWGTSYKLEYTHNTHICVYAP